MMKKIFIISAIFVFLSGYSANAACKIEDLGSCKVGLQGQNQVINDKLLPNHLNQMINPMRNSSREFKIAPHAIPPTINMDVDDDPENKSTNTPYNAGCQFGVCTPGTNNGGGYSP